MRPGHLFAALMLASLSYPASAAKLPPLPASTPSAYRLGAGDEIRITVFGLEAVSNNYVVGDAGTLAVPLIGAIAATGKTTDELQTALADAIRGRELVRNPSVSVQIQKYRPFFILGEVQKPGQYPYVPGMSVLAAVSIAGGYTFRANTKRVVIVRPVSGGNVRGSAPPEALVQPGDTVNVAEAWF